MRVYDFIIMFYVDYAVFIFYLKEKGAKVNLRPRILIFVLFRAGL